MKNPLGHSGCSVVMLKVRAPYSITSIRSYGGKVRQVRDETRVHDRTGASIASITADVQGMVPQLSHYSNWKKQRCSAREELCQINGWPLALETATSRSFAAMASLRKAGKHFSLIGVSVLPRSRDQEQINALFQHSFTNTLQFF